MPYTRAGLLQCVVNTMSWPSPETTQNRTQTKDTHPIPGKKLKFLIPPGIEPGPPGWKAGTLPTPPRWRSIINILSLFNLVFNVIHFHICEQCFKFHGGKMQNHQMPCLVIRQFSRTVTCSPILLGQSGACIVHGISHAPERRGVIISFMSINISACAYFFISNFTTLSLCMSDWHIVVLLFSSSNSSSNWRRFLETDIKIKLINHTMTVFWHAAYKLDKLGIIGCYFVVHLASNTWAARQVT